MNTFWGSSRNRDSGRPNTPPELDQEEDAQGLNTTILEENSPTLQTIEERAEEDIIEEMSAASVPLEVLKYDESKNGAVTLEEFIHSLDAVFNINTKWTDIQKTTVARSYMTGPVARWFDNMKKRPDDREKCNKWTELKDLLEKRFNAKTISLGKAKELVEIIQGNNEGVQEILTRIESTKIELDEELSDE